MPIKRIQIKEMDPRIAGRTFFSDKSKWYHISRAAEDKLIEEIDRILHSQKIDEEDGYREAYQEAANLDGAVEDPENFVAAYMRKLRKDHPLWKIMAMIGTERFYLLVLLFQDEPERVVEFPAWSTLYHAAAREDICRLNNRGFKNIDIANELKFKYPGIKISAEYVGRVIKKCPKPQSTEAEAEAHTKELNKLLRTLIIKHRLVPPKD